MIEALIRRLLLLFFDPIIIDARTGGVSGDAANDAALMEVIHAKKLSKKPSYMTEREAENVTDITGVFTNNTFIIDFRALEYFISLTSIGTKAFLYCTNLALIALPNGLTSIGYAAFMGCTNLELTKLPNGITSIGYGAFRSCTNLALTSLPSGVTSIGGNAFSGCTQLALTELPSGVTSIGNGAFSGCTNLALTALPSGVTSIGTGVFSGCTNLALTALPSGVTSISGNAFRGCTNITLSELPSGLTSIGYAAFFGCNLLKNIRILNTTSKITGAYSMFSSKPTIEVPFALLEEYQADENWNVYTLVGY